MSQHQMDIAKLCQHDNVGTIVVPGDWDMEGAGKICQQLGGHQAVVGSSYDQQKYLDIFMSSQQCAAKSKHNLWWNCPWQLTTQALSAAPKFYWTGWWDYPSEGTFTNVNNGSLLSENNFAPWGLGEPNGKYYENCAVVTENGMWKDFSCKLKTCAICTIKDPPVFTMKGWQLHLLDTLFINHVFILWLITRFMPWKQLWHPLFLVKWNKRQKWGSRIVYILRVFQIPDTMGQGNQVVEAGVIPVTTIRNKYNLTSSLPQVVFSRGGRTVAYLNNSRSAYPFGTNTWTFFNDTCSDSPQTIKTITFSSCNESEFSCTDGTWLICKENILLFNLHNKVFNYSIQC